MTAAILGWFVAGICIVVLVTCWFVISFKELSIMKKRLEIMREQVQMHRRLYMQERGGENDLSAKNILENKLMVYRELEKDYIALIKKTMNRIPAYIMGFHSLDKEHEN